MTHSQGYRCKTRHRFAREFRKHGQAPLSTYLKTYKLGQYVDIKVNGAYHKGMPHRFYHGHTGTVFNVAKRALGVEIPKRVGNRIMRKRISVRVEHISPSKCRDDHIARINQNRVLATAAKKAGTKACLKRVNEGPRAAHTVSKPKVVDLAPVKFEGVF